MNRFLVILMLVFSDYFVGAQTSMVKGVVYTKGSNEPLPSAGIYIEYKNQIIGSATTAADGSFNIENIYPRKYKVIVAKENYTPITTNAISFDADKITIKDFYLEPMVELKNEKAVLCDFKIMADEDMLNTTVRLGAYSFRGTTKSEENSTRKKVRLVKGMQLILNNDWLSNHLAEMCWLKKNKQLESVEIIKQKDKYLEEWNVILLFNYVKRQK